MNRLRTVAVLGLVLIAGSLPRGASARANGISPCGATVADATRLSDDGATQRYAVRIAGPVRTGTLRLQTATGHADADFMGDTIVRTTAPPDPVLAVTVLATGAQTTRQACSPDWFALFGRYTSAEIAAMAAAPSVDTAPFVLEPQTACPQAFVSARVVRAAEPLTPALAVQQGIRGTVRVAVSLDESGKPVSAHIVSSPSAVLNAISLRAARESEYAPPTYACRPARSTYPFNIEFGPS